MNKAGAYEHYREQARKVALPGDLLAGRYIDQKNVQDRFSGCIVLFDGEPFMAHTTTSGMLLDLYELNAMTKSGWQDNPSEPLHSKISANHHLLETDLRSDVGFVNVDEDNVMYLSRATWRKTLVGVSQTNTHVVRLSDGATTDSPGWLFYSVYLRNALRNNYLSFEECYKRAIKGLTAANNTSAAGGAFSKRFALVRLYKEKETSLYHNTQKVGRVSKLNEVTLDPLFKNDSIITMHLHHCGVKVEEN